MKTILEILLVMIFVAGIIFFVFFYKHDIKIPMSSTEILQNRDFVELPEADKYHFVSTREFSLDEINTSSVDSYFQADGQPIFFKSDPPYHGEIIKNNPNKVYALEISTSEPDMSVSLWDLKESKVYIVAQCGTACSFSGLYWISNSKFAVLGIERGYGEGENTSADSRFVNIYNLSDMTAVNYSDKN